MDAHDDPSSGKLYLFGKVWAGCGGGRSPESGCVVVEEMERCLLLVPKRDVRGAVIREQARAALAEEAEGAEGGASREEVNQVLQAAPEGCAVEQVEEAIVKFVMHRLFEDLREDIIYIKNYYKLRKVKAKPVFRNYCFDKSGVSRGMDKCLIKLNYDASLPPVDVDVICSRASSNVKHIFGANTSLLELFLVKRRIMGPCWLRLYKCRPQASSRASWCQREYVTANHKFIRTFSEPPPSGCPDALTSVPLPPPPPLTLMCLSITTLLNKQTPEICFAGVLYTKHCDIDNMNDRAHRQCRHVIAVRKLASGWTWPDEFSDRVKDNRTVVLQNNEKSLIAGLCSQVQEIDPDVIIGHNVFAFDLEVLWARFHSLGLPFFHKFSRLKRRPPPRKGGAAPPGGMGAGRQLTIGRVVCDTYVQARDLLRNKVRGMKALSVPSYSNCVD
eukprot:GHVS01077069.1.p1 GENE.GHVS01077069.1~~GHVS01077069.1.p1  ORF type:complete len:444 (+),score=82.18 GHVS01077069.1:783-2114(+)